MKGRILAIVVLLLSGPTAADESIDRYFVRLRCTDESTATFSERTGLTVIHPADALPGAVLVRVSDRWSRAQVLELLRSDSCVADVEADETVRLPHSGDDDDSDDDEDGEDDDEDAWRRRATALPDLTGQRRVSFFGDLVDQSYVQQPATRIVGTDSAHRSYATGAGVVAIIDTGIDPTHPAVRRVLVPGYDFVREEPGWASEWRDLDSATAAVLSETDGTRVDQSSVAVLNQSSVAVLNQSTVAVLNEEAAERLRTRKYASFGHGTMVAGLVHRVAPRARLMPLKVFRADGSARLSDVVRAIYYAVDHGADVINMSFSFSDFSSELMRALNHATRAGVVCVASVGNGGERALVYPASFANVIGVAATTNEDLRSESSNFGDDTVFLAAPGESLITTYPGGRFAAGFGTSFSAAMVSGAAALLVEMDKNVAPYEAALALGQGKPLRDELGNGRLDLVRALRFHRQASQKEDD